MAAAHTSARECLRAYRPNNECTTASKYCLWRGVLRFRLRRIKTFESLRAAKFRLRASTARWAGDLLGYAVNIAPAEQHLAGGDSQHFAGGQQPLERSLCRRIMALVV